MIFYTPDSFDVVFQKSVSNGAQGVFYPAHFVIVTGNGEDVAESGAGHGGLMQPQRFGDALNDCLVILPPVKDEQPVRMKVMCSPDNQVARVNHGYAPTKPGQSKKSSRR